MAEVGHWQRSDEELLRAVAESEARMRREYAASLALIAELDARDVAAAVGYSGLASLLRDVARISTAEARRRISQAGAVTETPIVSGGVVPAALPVAAVALREGVLGGDHVEEIAKVVRELPLHVPDADRELAEQVMVKAAHTLDARGLATLGRQVRDRLDPDGAPPNDRELVEPVNELHLTTRRNGRLALRGDFDPEASALITTVLSPLAKPRPSTDTGPDPRSAAERQGDALVEVFQLTVDSGTLPSEAGEKPHILVTVPLATLRTSIDHTVLDGAGQPSKRGQRGTDHNLASGSATATGLQLSDPDDDSCRQLADSTNDTGWRQPDPADNSGWPRFDLAKRSGWAHPGPDDSSSWERRDLADDTSWERRDLADDTSWERCDLADDVGRTSSGRIGRLPRRPDHAVLDGIGTIDAESARRIACDARIIPVVLGSRSEPLDLGRSSYTVSTALRRALVLRDRGCAFPGCDRPHRHCHGHHIRHWADDGPTELDNLVLLCGRHHRLIHHSEWECAVENGRAEFRPPRFVDATRKPRHNLLHAA